MPANSTPLSSAVNDYLKYASLDEKRRLWKTLSVDIALAELKTVSLATLNAFAATVEQPTATPDTSPQPEVLTDYLEHVSDLGITDDLNQTVLTDLKKLRLRSKGSKGKPAPLKSQWLSPSDTPYRYGNVVKDPKPIGDYPGICQLMDIVNQHPSSGGNMNAAHVTGMTTAKTKLGLHCDNEPLICQKSAICTVSFGSERELEFVWNSSEPTSQGNGRTAQYKADYTLPARNLTMNVMKAGCQALMRHRVPAGAGTGMRWSISFRRIVAPVEDIDFTSHSPAPSTPPRTSPPTPASATPPEDAQHVPGPTKKRVVLMAGASFYERLDAEKLGTRRSRKVTVVKLSRGGRKIAEVQKSVEDYLALNPDIDVKSLFVSIGTNDIRHCTDGIKHLRSPLCEFIKTMKKLCPNAKIWVQSLLPIPINGLMHIGRNVIAMNNMLFNLCSRYKIFYLDVFGSFLNRFGGTDLGLFPEKVGDRIDIHPNPKGMGLLARHYKYLIHSKRFNPLGY